MKALQLRKRENKLKSIDKEYKYVIAKKNENLYYGAGKNETLSTQFLPEALLYESIDEAIFDLKDQIDDTDAFLDESWEVRRVEISYAVE